MYFVDEDSFLPNMAFASVAASYYGSIPFRYSNNIACFVWKSEAAQSNLLNLLYACLYECVYQWWVVFATLKLDGHTT